MEGDGDEVKEQSHEQLNNIHGMLDEIWWPSVFACLCFIAVVANLIFIVTVIYNR